MAQFGTKWVSDEYGNLRNIEAYHFVIQVKQVFHLKNTYTWAWEWLKEEGFIGLDEEKERIETMYDEKIDPDGKRTMRVWWRCIYDPDKSSYYRYRMNIFWEMNGIQKTEIMYKGKKMKVDEGEVFLHCWSILELDYDRNWLKNPFLKRLDKLFMKRIYKKQREHYEEDLRRRAMRYQEDMKRIMEVQNYEQYPERFHTEKGF
jgi:hypothetical protein